MFGDRGLVMPGCGAWPPQHSPQSLEEDSGSNPPSLPASLMPSSSTSSSTSESDSVLFSLVTTVGSQQVEAQYIPITWSRGVGAGWAGWANAHPLFLLALYLKVIFAHSLLLLVELIFGLTHPL